MEPDENHHHACKRSRGADPGQPAKIGHKEQQHQEEEGDDEGEDGEEKAGVNGGGGGGSGNNGANSALWQNHISSRIYRVSRASGGKDRHSKVYTAKGLRDRRVRLSVSTAIQFYDLQDRLGYDQPSKAIEWLIKAAAAAIDELPALDGFPNPPPPPSGEDKLMDASTEGAPRYNQQQRHLATKSGCSSTSETSKGSVLSLSRTTECRVKAREPARERAAEESDEAKCHVIASDHHQKSLNPGVNSRSSSFTELLIRGGGGSNNGAVVAAVSAGEMELAPNSVQKKTSTANYFGQACLFTQPQKAPHLRSGYSLPSNHSVHSSALGMMPFNIAAAGAAAAGQGDHQEMHPFSSFLQDHLIPVSAVAATEDYNLNFSVSPVLAGFNRGTLQSNSPSQLPHHHQHHHHQSYDHLHRLSTPVDGPMLPFFLGSAAAVSTAIATASGENQFSFGFDGRLQLCYGDGSGFGLLDLKRKEKS